MRSWLVARGGVATALAAAAALLVAVAAGGEPGAGQEPASPGVWEPWGQEVHRLEPGEVLQFRVEFAQIPVRAWRLLVEGGQVLSDLVIRREADGSLLYSSRNESRHDVLVPWGQGEAVAAALSPGRTGGGLYTVTLLGPPRDAAPLSHSYRVNRALEAFAAGQRARARRLCEQALAENAGDGAALVLLAGFLRDEAAWARVAGLTEQALALELPPGTRGAAASLRGEALHRLGRLWEAVAAYEEALALATTDPERAVIHLRLARLFLDLENAAQARAAFSIARRLGLAPDLDAEAAAALARLGPETAGDAGPAREAVR